jgi:enamine deaminase RidA (YjgF/YER057c/UK114 family)
VPLNCFIKSPTDKARMIEERLLEMGLELPPAPKPAGSYVPVVEDGELVYVSGQVPLQIGAVPDIFKGKVSSVVSVSRAQDAAKLCTLNALSHIKSAIGNLDNVSKFIRVAGYVNSDPAFADHPKIVNAASELLTNIFGDRGKHARIAIGVNSLPLDSVIEIEFLLKSHM